MSKIIIIGPAYPLRGGLATFDERMARQLMQEGHDVTIYTFSLQYPKILFPGKTQYSESAPPMDLKIKVCINSINPFNWIKIGRLLKKENADCIITRYWLPFMAPCLGTILRIACNNNHTHSIAIVDNAIPHEKRPGDDILTRYFVKYVHSFVAMSEKVKNDLSIFTNKKVSLVQHPLSDNFGVKISKKDARQRLNISDTAYVFLFFGFIRHYKGLDLLISAMDKVKGDILLLIAGEYYAGEESIKTQLAHSASMSRIMTHTHFIKDEEVSLYFSAADCVVQPYRNATQSGVTPLAYYFEVPMIVTNVGGLPDLVPQGIGLICEPQPESIAEAMNAMLHFDVKEFESKIANEKKKLSWATFTHTLLNIGKLNED